MEFFKEALNALPVVATSPLALAAFLATVLAATVILFRVARISRVLEHLQKLPEEDRLEALKIEMRHVRLARGLSPEQYLRGQTHKYYLIAMGMVVGLVALLAVLAAISRKEGEIVIPVPPPPAPNCGAVIVGGGNAQVDCSTKIFYILTIDPQIDPATKERLLRELGEQRRKIEELSISLTKISTHETDAVQLFDQRFALAMNQPSTSDRVRMLEEVVKDAQLINTTTPVENLDAEVARALQEKVRRDLILPKRPPEIAVLPTQERNCEMLPWQPSQSAFATNKRMGVDARDFRSFSLRVQWFFTANACITFSDRKTPAEQSFCEAAKVVSRAGLTPDAAEFQVIHREFRIRGWVPKAIAKIHSCFGAES